MKKVYMSTIAAAILSTGAMAQSNTIKEAFQNGKVSGDVSVYVENVNKSGDNKDAGFSMTSIGLNYETDTVNGFAASLGFRTNHKLSEEEDGDFDENGNAPKSVLNTANISYANEYATIIAGRQEIDLEWIADYHEAVVGVFNVIPDTTIVAAHTNKFMAADNDAVLEEMTDIGTHGASVIDVKYEGIADTVINPYFMNANDLFSAYGLKGTTTIANIDLTAHYAATNEDTAGKEDGSIAHLEIGTSISDISLAAGYITTDKDGGAGSIASIGDNIDPTEDLGDFIYDEADVDAIYASIAADISSVSLSALYTTVNYGSNDNKTSEIVLTAGTAITDELSLDLLVSSIDAQDSSDDSDKITLMASYSF